MYTFKRNEIENPNIIELTPIKEIVNNHKFFKVEYEFNDGKLSQINLPNPQPLFP